MCGRSSRRDRAALIVRPLRTPADYHPVRANALYIGAGRPDLPDPRFPFVGKIQCVALYKGALTLDDVLTHYHNGNGIDP